jgi:hypothetical protein
LLSDLNASEGAEQLLNDLNSLHASFGTGNFEPLNVEALIPPTSGNSMGDPKHMPVYTYMNPPTTASNAPIWPADELSSSSSSAGLMSTGTMATGSVPGAALSVDPSLGMTMPIGNDLGDQPSGMSVTDYQEASTMMEMVPGDMRGNQQPQLDSNPSKDVTHHKRNTLSTWASSLSWTKAPRVLVVEDDAVS